MKHLIIEDVLIPHPESYKDCLELVRSDFYRIMGKRVHSSIKLWLSHYKTPAMGYLFYHRLCQYRGLLWPILRIRLEKYRRKYSFHIPLSTKIGYGLFLGHDTSIIINESAIIGNNVNLSQFTTIGAINSSAAIIEDEVYIGPSVCIVDHVHIGKRAMIGAGAVVTHDIPAGASAAGVPARILNLNVNYSPALPYPLPQHSDTAQ